MKKFEFNLSTKLYFGSDYIDQVGEIIKSYNYKKVLLHYGKNSIKKIGLYDRIISSFNKYGIAYCELGGVRPNPEVSLVREGIKLCRKENVDFILAVGGGSTLDSSKLISHGVFYEGDPYDISLKKYVSNKCLPIGSIITIAAAGSEMSTSCVISNDVDKIKRGFNTELNRPKFVIEDPSLTYSLPMNQVNYGIVDMFSHTFERYFNKSSEIEFADYLAEGVLKSIIDSAEVLIKDPLNEDARTTIMLASSYAHNGLTSIGKNGFMPIHQLEHEISGLREEVPHGEGLAILIPAWMKMCYKLDEDKFYKFSKNVMGIEGNNKEQVIIDGINKLDDLFTRLNMPKSLEKYNLSEEDIVFMANRITINGTKPFPSNIPLTKELAIEVYRKCR